ncbi:MAG: DNA polymerase beta superfamily protein [Chitinophagales bacterium]
MKININFLKENNLILFECISGSTAYGLNTASSDIDIKGVFYLPKEQFFGLNYIPQVSDEKNDVVYYEIGRFIELLSVSNPNILEMMFTDEQFIKINCPLFQKIKKDFLLSIACKNTFAGYAFSQIKKAKGLNKKIVNPIDKKRKTVLDFCYVSEFGKSIPIHKYLEANKLKQENCGLVKLNHMKDVFALYHSLVINYSGIISSEKANDISLSSVEKGEKALATFYFNKDGYSQYCKEYKQYWDWVAKRNEARYENTVSNEANYDAKNMMHTFRLLNMAEEIATESTLNVFRKDREFLLSIKNGERTYDELVQLAEKKLKKVQLAFDNSDLNKEPNIKALENILIEIRTELYK